MPSLDLQLETPTAIRLRLLDQGYLPIPVNGKRPRILNWSSIRAVPASIESWERGHTDHLNTGILTGEVVAIDIDALNFQASERLLDRFLEIDDASLAPCRVGMAPKSLFVFRTTAPRSKIATAEYMVEGAKCQVEMLGSGQQFIGFGTHPDTGEAYRWTGASLLDVPFLDLPEISSDAIDAFVADAEAILAEMGQPIKAKVIERERSAGGRTFWQRVNSSALSNIESWVREIFPTAKREAGTGAWRVISRDLGRSLEEDISVHPDGIRDFGVEAGTTPIHLAVDFGSASGPREAAHWLCERLGIDPVDLGWTASAPAAVADNPAAALLVGKVKAPEAANDNTPGLDIFAWKSSRFVGEPPPVEYLVEGVVPLALPVMVAAMGDTGKSYAMMEIGRRAAFGESNFATPIFGGNVKKRGTAVFIT